MSNNPVSQVQNAMTAVPPTQHATSAARTAAPPSTTAAQGTSKSASPSVILHISSAAVSAAKSAQQEATESVSQTASEAKMGDAQAVQKMAMRQMQTPKVGH